MQRGHLDQIEGLRGYLALWVAIGHGLQLAGFLSLPFPFSFLLRGEAAVALFMILSGFVITHLLLRGSETYPQYITRRFFRLFPVYAVGCLVGYLVLSLWADTVTGVPWRDVPGWGDYVASVEEIARQTYDNTLPHLLLHATMLHGLVPAEWLPRSAMTFLPAAWSLSLEWQFYLIAPLVIGSLRSPPRLLALVLFFAVLLVLYEKGVLGSYVIPATLAATGGWFAIGIVSRLLYPVLQTAELSAPMVSAGALFVILAFSPEFLPLGIWATFYFHLLWGRRTRFVGELFDVLTTSRLPMLVGRISYSIYLIHRPVQVLLGYAALQMIDVTRPVMLVVQGVAIVLSVPVAYAMYRFIEAPGIAVGRRAAAAFAVREPKPA